MLYLYKGFLIQFIPPIACFTDSKHIMSQDLHNSIVADLQQKASSLSIEETIGLLVQSYPGAVTLSTSFSYEDQIITDIIQTNQFPVSLFTLDTGRLFPETYSTWSRTLEYYKTSIKAYYPDADLLAEYIQAHGPNAFYDTPELRSACCTIRKVIPLKKALAGNTIWITGLRAEHSAARQNLTTFEWDAANRLIKYHPLLNWTTAAVKTYIHQKGIPYNPLHDKGFVSIGCAPCTRAIRPGEDFRAGRWWWEDNSKKECGLHSHEPQKKAEA